MNLLLLESADFVAADQVVVTDRRCEHVRKILRRSVGETIRVGQLDGLIGSGTIERIERGHLALNVAFDTPPPAALAVTLAIALPRPPSLQKALAYATAMGVKRFELFHSARVEKSYWTSHAVEEQSLGEHLRLGLEQAVDTVLPRVTLHRRFLPFVEDVLPTLGGPIVVAHPHEPEVEPANNVEAPAVIVVGPEGGFVPFEVERLERAGACRLSLGPRILRVETAIVALLSRLA